MYRIMANASFSRFHAVVVFLGLGWQTNTQLNLQAAFYEGSFTVSGEIVCSKCFLAPSKGIQPDIALKKVETNYNILLSSRCLV